MRDTPVVFFGLLFGGVILVASSTGTVLGPDLRIDCTEKAFREALEKVAQAGGGRIAFKQSGGVLNISDTIKLLGNDVIVDGEDRNITVRYTGPDDCSQKEGQDRFLEIYGDRNVVRNFTLDRFPDGIHVQQGFDNVIENLRFPVVCEDAVTNSGMGFEAFRTIIRNCYFESSEDKAVMINNGGSVTVENCEFVNCQQPVRAGGRSGRHTVRGCKFRGANSTGPRFSGGQEGMVLVFENNTVENAQFGIRIYGNVEAIVRNNSFHSWADEGCSIYVFENARVRFEGNTVHAGGKGGVLVQGLAKVDLGGGRVVVAGDSEPSRGLNIFKSATGPVVVNETPSPIQAKNNIWNHKSAGEVSAADVKGAVEVEPLGNRER